MAKILITGGAGYIGSQTAKTLFKAGHQVVAFDNLSTGFRKLVKFGPLLEGDLRDQESISSAVQKIKPDVVMHFAAKALVGESVEKPDLYYDNNVNGSLKLFQALVEHSPNAKLIFSSTCSLYGTTDEPISELQPLAPMNPYAKSKAMVEGILADYSSAYGLNYVALRYFNAAGCDPEGEVGELHEPEVHLIPRLLLHTLNPASYPVTIFGNDYPTNDGTCVRDYIHVEDLAEAHRLAMEYLLKGSASDVFNLGTTRGSSVLEVVRQVEKVTGKKLNLSHGPRRAGDPPNLVAGSKKAVGVLGWRPKHDLESIVRTAWAWTEKNRR